MIGRKLNEITMTKEVQDAVEEFNVPGGWDEKSAAVKAFKDELKQKLLDNQDYKCAYCGLPLKTRNPEIDHIAPKGGASRPKYPQFSFLTLNLVYACHNCNSPECKGQTDVVELKSDENYRNWTFKLVHPYLDDPNDFFECNNAGDIIVLPKKDASECNKKKARYTIDMFNLDSEAKLMEMAKQIQFERQPEEIKRIVIDISTYKE